VLPLAACRLPAVLSGVAFGEDGSLGGDGKGSALPRHPLRKKVEIQIPLAYNARAKLLKRG